MKFNFEKPTVHNSESENAKADLVNNVVADLEDFTETKEGKRSMDTVYYRDAAESADTDSRKNKEIFEANSEKFSEEVAERLNASREKVNNILDRFKRLKEAKKDLFYKKAGRVMTKLAGFSAVAGMVGGFGTFAASTLEQSYNSDMGTAMAISGTATVLGGMYSMFKGTSQEEVLKSHAAKHEADSDVYSAVNESIDSNEAEQSE